MMSGDGGGEEEREAGGRGRAEALTGRSSASSRVGSAVRGRGRTTASRGQRARARELASAAGDIDLRGMELDRAADLVVLGGDDGCKPIHTDLSSPAQPWAGAPQVALAGASPEPFS
jgi:hypothetical protein